MKQLKKQISEKNRIKSFFKDLLTFNPIKKLIRGFVALMIIFVLSSIISTITETPIYASSSINSIEKKIYYINNVRSKSTGKLIQEVDIYMKAIAPSTKLDATKLVNLCLKYEMNITFVIAQGILESHLGTKGIALYTNSVWNVGTYDDGQIHYTYNDPNESIEPYLKLLKNSYLIKISSSGDTISRPINQLIQDRGFTNYKGKRYASSPIYENALRNMMIQVNIQSSINVYQGIAGLPDHLIMDFFGPIDSTYLAIL
jgi:hypothetical protein